MDSGMVVYEKSYGSGSKHTTHAFYLSMAGALLIFLGIYVSPIVGVVGFILLLGSCAFLLVIGGYDAEHPVLWNCGLITDALCFLPGLLIAVEGVIIAVILILLVVLLVAMTSVLFAIIAFPLFVVLVSICLLAVITIVCCPCLTLAIIIGAATQI